MSTTCLDRGRSSAQGFTLLSALFLLVALGALAVALGRISQRSHLGAASALASAQARLAVRAGLEWGAFAVLREPAPPAAAPGCFEPTSFVPDAGSAVTVTVRCIRTPTSGTVSDGAEALVFFTLTANACNQPDAGRCPRSGTVDPLYVESAQTWTVMR